MKPTSAIADEILSNCPDFSERDRAALKAVIVEEIGRDRAQLNQLIQSRLRVPNYILSKLIQEIEQLLLSETPMDEN